MKTVVSNIKELDLIRGGIITDIDPLEDHATRGYKGELIIIDILEVEDGVKEVQVQG